MKASSRLFTSLDRIDVTPDGAGSLVRYDAELTLNGPLGAFDVFLKGAFRKIGEIEKFPRLKAWAEALIARPSTHSFPEAEFEDMYRQNLRRRNSYLSQFVEAPRAAAE